MIHGIMEHIHIDGRQYGSKKDMKRMNFLYGELSNK